MSYQRVGQYEGGEVMALIALADVILRGADGSTANFVGYKATRTQQVDDVLSSFETRLSEIVPGKWQNALITQVLPNSSIPPHKDALKDGLQRFHLVLATNHLSWVMHDGDWQQLEQGGIYTMDPRKVHAAVNWGGKPRTHLVVDV